MASQILGPFEGSGLNFMNFSGKTLAERYKDFNHWGTLREEQNIWPFGMINDNRRPLNFGTQDYLGFSVNKEVVNSLKEFINSNQIIHSAGSPTLTGRTIWTAELEEKIASLLKQKTALIFPSGWMACFGAVAGLTNGRDTIVIDALAHNCMQVAAKYSTKNLLKFRHNDMVHLDEILEKCRQDDDINGLFIVTESLFSMNSDSPDLRRVMELAHKYEAIVIIDTAHDLGVIGKTGLGALETIDIQYAKNLVICGAFSKAFGTNGGFVAGPAEIRKHLVIMTPTYIFSTGASPLQCHVAGKSLDLIFSGEGEQLRLQLKELVEFTVKKFKKSGFTLIGKPTQIIPVLIGNERMARMIFREAFSQGLMINLVEFPAVPKGRAIFRFQLMATHKKADIEKAIEILKNAKEKAENSLTEMID
ncbi:MAG: pyridoxal phosphate-dependent aminotransferase family protein [Bacteroidales bacterium]